MSVRKTLQIDYREVMLNHIFALPVERSPDIGEQSIKRN